MSMSMLTMLWMPALASAVAVFVLSAIMHMALPWWHRSDYVALPNEAAVMDALRPLAIPPGEYLAPRPASNEDMRSAEFVEKMNRGPVFSINIRPNGPGSLGKLLGLWFVYLLVVNWIVGHIAQAALGSNADHGLIMHTVGLSAFLAYCGGLWQMAIWFNRSVKTTVKATVDSFLYAIVTALVFVWLWPH